MALDAVGLHPNVATIQSTRAIYSLQLQFTVYTQTFYAAKG